MVPLLSGFGYATLALTALVACCSLMVLPKTFAYLGHSLLGTLTWGNCTEHDHCSKWDNGYKCFTRHENADCSEDEVFLNCSCHTRDQFCEDFGYVKEDSGYCTTNKLCLTDDCR